MKALTQLDEVRVQSCKKRKYFLKKVKGHEIGGDEGVIELVELEGQEVVEAMEGSGCT